MAVTLYTDPGQPRPWEIPADAVAVLAWSTGRVVNTPPGWHYVCMATGATDPSDLANPLKDAYPELAGQTVLISPVGGNRSRIKKLQISETITRAVTEVDPSSDSP